MTDEKQAEAPVTRRVSVSVGEAVRIVRELQVHPAIPGPSRP